MPITEKPALIIILNGRNSETDSSIPNLSKGAWSRVLSGRTSTVCTLVFASLISLLAAGVGVAGFKLSSGGRDAERASGSFAVNSIDSRDNIQKE